MAAIFGGLMRGVGAAARGAGALGRTAATGGRMATALAQAAKAVAPALRAAKANPSIGTFSKAIKALQGAGKGLKPLLSAAGTTGEKMMLISAIQNSGEMSPSTREMLETLKSKIEKMDQQLNRVKRPRGSKGVSKSYRKKR